MTVASLSSDPHKHTMTYAHPGHTSINVIKHFARLSYIKAENIQKLISHASLGFTEFVSGFLLLLAPEKITTTFL